MKLGRSYGASQFGSTYQLTSDLGWALAQGQLGGIREEIVVSVAQRAKECLSIIQVLVLHSVVDTISLLTA